MPILGWCAKPAELPDWIGEELERTGFNAVESNGCLTLDY
jgi:hypothetical protein